MSLRTDFLALDDALAARGVPALTAWWRDGVGAWLDAYERGCVLELWACVGRGAAKSTALYKLALFFALFGAFDVPVGEVHYAVVISRLTEEAQKGIAIIARWLTLLEVPHRPTGDTIGLLGEYVGRGIRVVAKSVAATSGWRAFFVGRDERSKWASASGGSDELDAEEVDTSAAAMTATHERAPVVSFGSAWGAFGTYYDAIMSGTDATKHVLGPAPTWIAAPHISEESCRRKERDPKRFAREYACEFQASGVGAFDAEMIDPCFVPRRMPPSVYAAAPTVIIDASNNNGKDAFTYGLCRWYRPQSTQYKVRKQYSAFVGWSWEFVEDEHGRPVPLEEGERFASTLRFEWVREVTGRVGAAQVVDQIVRDGAGARVVGDQREQYSLGALFAQRGASFTPIAWTAPNKPAAVELVRRWMLDRQLWLPSEQVGVEMRPHAKLRNELLTFEEKITQSGQLTYGARGRNHDDYVALLVTAALAEQNGLLSQSPAGRRVERSIPRGLIA